MGDHAFTSMLVANWMTRDPIAAVPDNSIAEVAALMSRHRVRRLPILDEEHLVGIVTRNDLLKARRSGVSPFSVEAHSEASLARPVREIMIHNPRTVAEDAPIERAARLMVDQEIGALPVMTGRQLIGIITESDIFRAFTAVLGEDIPGLRITFQTQASEDAVGFAVDLARRHGIRVVNVMSVRQEAQFRVVVRFSGLEPAALLDELWASGHKVLSVVRYA